MDHKHIHLHFAHEPRHAANDDEDDLLGADAVQALLIRQHAEILARLTDMEHRMATADEQSKYNAQIAAMAADVATIKADLGSTVPLDLSAGEALKAELDALVPAPVVPAVPVAEPSAIRYEHVSSNPIDPAFTPNGNAPDGTQLYTFSGDPSTVSTADWSIFNG